MNLQYGHVYEIKFVEGGPRPSNSIDVPDFIRVTGVSIGDALQRWEASRAQYNLSYPPIESIIQVLEGTYY